MTWELLSEATSHTEHTCTRYDRRGCRGCRWFEVKLSRLVVDGAKTKYEVVISGMSVLAGEQNRVRSEISTSPHAIVDFLALGEPNARYIPKVSRKAIHEAADTDSALADALDDFDEIASARR